MRFASGRIAMNTYSHFERDFKRWTRGKVAIFTALITPTAWLIFVGLTMSAKFTGDYLNFITPGILIMTMLFSSLQGGMYMSFDKLLGYLNKFMAMPSGRESILFGKVLFISVRGLVQVSMVLAIAFIMGANVKTGLLGLVAIYLILFLFGCMLSSFAITVAMLTPDYDTYSAINGLISMPMFFASTALMPFSSMPVWMRAIAGLNPVSYTIDGVRAMFMGNLVAGLFGIVEVTAMAAAMSVICIYAFRRATIG
jgi:ABC-2 type transport system permease protein